MAHFQKDGLWVQGGQGALANVSEDTPFVPGQVGRVMSVRSTDGKAPRFYQYVKRYTTETNTGAAGKLAYWQDLDDFIVTGDPATAIGGTTNPLVAGVWLGTSPAAGKYGFIQVGGLASVAVTGTVSAGQVLGSTDTVGNAAAVTGTATTANSKPSAAVILTNAQTATGTLFSAVLNPIKNAW